MGWVELIGRIFELAVLVVEEIFLEKKRAREAREKFELNKLIFDQAVNRATSRMRTWAKKESDQARDVEDRIDREKQP